MTKEKLKQTYYKDTNNMYYVGVASGRIYSMPLDKEFYKEIRRLYSGNITTEYRERKIRMINQKFMNYEK